MINPKTIAKRIERGMTPEEAATTPLQHKKQTKLNMAQVLEMESHGLSLSASSYLLNVSNTTLSNFIKKHGVEWRGKGVYNGIRQPDCDHQRILTMGYPTSTIYARMKRKNMTIDEALAMGWTPRKEKKTATEAALLKKMRYIETLGLSVTASAKLMDIDKGTLSKRIKEFGIEWRGKKNTGAKQ